MKRRGLLNYAFSLLIIGGHNPYAISSLTRGRVYRLQLLLVLASAVILGSESRGTRVHILLSDSRLPQPGGPGPRIYIPQEQGSSVIPPGTGFLFRRLLRLVGPRWRYSNPPINTRLVLLVTLRHGPHSKHSFQQFFYCVTGVSHGPRREHCIPISH
jgi:hypothetical protein